MKKLFALAMIGLGLGFIPFATGGCGDGGSGSGSTSDGATTGGSTTSGQSCFSAHVCINGSCNCGKDGKGSSCTDNTKCEAECKVCM